MIIIAWGGAREGGREGCLEKLEAVVGFAALDDGFFSYASPPSFFYDERWTVHRASRRKRIIETRE